MSDIRRHRIPMGSPKRCPEPARSVSNVILGVEFGVPNEAAVQFRIRDVTWDMVVRYGSEVVEACVIDVCSPVCTSD